MEPDSRYTLCVPEERVTAVHEAPPWMYDNIDETCVSNLPIQR